MIRNLDKVLINKDTDIISALRKLNESSTKVLVVVDDLKNKILIGTLTDGDIRRHILKTGSIEGNVYEVCNKNPIFLAKSSLDKNVIKKLILEKKIELIPIINEKNEVIDYVEWSELLKQEEFDKTDPIKDNIPVVIMAGGKGTRLDPFTKVLPKPLLPIKDKTITELIIDTFKKYGVKKFYLTLNYKGKIIESYFNSVEKDYEIDFLWEKDFLGTAGSLYMLKDINEDNFFVTNCDIILNVDYSEVYNHHKSMGAMFTSITAIQHYKIPYGVVYTKEDGLIEKIEEKPENTFQINTGVYLLNKEVIKYIEPDTYLDMPKLVEMLIRDNKKVIAYPISESYYLDVGQWDEYKKVMKILEER
ncbi:MAG: mannose-1-phosphate guanylyltransferase [Candidatus Woesearchaeota archaeon]|nr:MAG: mannose-1-phosphate guanylyltransferase [Candidatus Woesearchaeota archaeon]